MGPQINEVKNYKKGEVGSVPVKPTWDLFMGAYQS